jgi:hypothetical protein
MRKVLWVFGLSVLLVSCASQPMAQASEPGFLMGVLHGIIMPFSLIGSFFDQSIRIYAFPNSGFWYDAGFVLGALLCLGGGGASTRASD